MMERQPAWRAASHSGARESGRELHVKLLEDHEDAGDDQLGAILALQDGDVGVPDQARLAGRVQNVLQLHINIVNATRALQHLQQEGGPMRQQTGLKVHCSTLAEQGRDARA